MIERKMLNSKILLILLKSFLAPRRTTQTAEHTFSSLLLVVLIPSHSNIKTLCQDNILFFQEKHKAPQFRNHRIPSNWWGGSSGGCDAFTSSHGIDCWQAHHSAGRQSQHCCVPIKHVNCQPADLIQLLAGFEGANTSFAQKRKGDSYSG